MKLYLFDKGGYGQEWHPTKREALQAQREENLRQDPDDPDYTDNGIQVIDAGSNRKRLCEILNMHAYHTGWSAD
tara:strand:+ start:132 stop:353 length:222 start_codon:yes stop_codon:yes gene_type:complete